MKRLLAEHTEDSNVLHILPVCTSEGLNLKLKEIKLYWLEDHFLKQKSRYLWISESKEYFKFYSYAFLNFFCSEHVLLIRKK